MSAATLWKCDAPDCRQDTDDAHGAEWFEIARDGELLHAHSADCVAIIVQRFCVELFAEGIAHVPFSVELMGVRK